jgi:hypothetical protein
MTATDPTPPSTGWRVTSQQEGDDLQDGRFVPGVRVRFITAIGQSGSVFVPREQYNANTVRAMINAQAAEMDAVGGLSS